MGQKIHGQRLNMLDINISTVLTNSSLVQNGNLTSYNDKLALGAVLIFIFLQLAALKLLKVNVGILLILKIHVLTLCSLFLFRLPVKQ